MTNSRHLRYLVSKFISSLFLDLIRKIKDPEHPLTLEQLNVISLNDISIAEGISYKIIKVLITPTIPHCSMATLIGLCIIVMLIKSVSPIHKISVEIKEGTHQSEDAINKQLNDKERVAAAMENEHLLRVVMQCISPPSLAVRSKQCCND